MAITVYFVRHGQTYLNRYHRVQGWSDAPLTSQGQTDAKRTGKVLSGHVKGPGSCGRPLQGRGKPRSILEPGQQRH